MSRPIRSAHAANVALANTQPTPHRAPTAPRKGWSLPLLTVGKVVVVVVAVAYALPYIMGV